MATELIDKFCRLYESLDKHNLDQLGLLYSDDINFIDALHNLNGLDQLSHYFANLYANLLYCHFSIEQVIEDQGQASVIWIMEYAHPKINKANAIVVNGCSHLKYDEKIYYHRDFLDMGQMLYEHLPLLGGVIRTVKKRVVS
ncbi:nuclear transport factor 2 family protein [Psychromonas sp.]|uniref:nuclear transport factor 2 family protein n=1 Tax=Psychromonas sp. TaxID=1884585 RepID=UPI003562F6E6